MERTDVIIDYNGEQFVIELKLWRGNAYHERGEKQLLDYLAYYHLKRGYMLSFNFNKKKQIGVKEIAFGEKVLVEATVWTKGGICEKSVCLFLVEKTGNLKYNINALILKGKLIYG